MLARAAVLPILLAAPLTAAPAHAEEPAVTVLARAYVAYTPVVGGWRVCGDGSAEPTAFASGLWTFTMHGARDGNPFAETPQTTTGSSAHLCATVLRASTTGFVAASLTYLGDTSDVVGFSLHGYTWEPNTGTRPFGVDPRP